MQKMRKVRADKVKEMEYSVTLEKYSGPASRYDCPNCGENKRFTRYIYFDTKEHVGPEVGICSRINNCGYHKTPKQFFKENGITFNQNELRHQTKNLIDNNVSKNETSFINHSIIKKHIKGTKFSNLIRFVGSKYEWGKVREVTTKFVIGTSNKFGGGATVFWQIDNLGYCRTGKIIQYNSKTGKRTKKPFNQISWIHKELGIEKYNLDQCFFGLHQIRGEHQKDKVIGIVESEKTAVLMTIEYPQLIWMATGGFHNLKKERFIPLKGLRVALFPDVGAYDLWKSKADGLSRLVPDLIVSDLLEKRVNNNDGADLVDFIL